MTPERSPSGQWVVYERATGQRMERWPVDARGMLERGEVVPVWPIPETPEPLTPVEPPESVPLVVQPAETAPPAQPVVIPTGRTSKGKRA
jgi:hypothetical protein